MIILNPNLISPDLHRGSLKAAADQRAGRRENIICYEF